MTMFRKKQLAVEARQLHFSNSEEIAEIAKWCHGTVTKWDGEDSIEFRRDTGRIQIAVDGDWIIKDEYGSCDTIDEALLMSIYEIVK